jgi:purine-binding chemotaxis protein CheW
MTNQEASDPKKETKQGTTSTLEHTTEDQDKKKTSAENIMEIVTFYLANEKYGIDIMQTFEVIKWERLTPIPNSLDFVEGVYNLRGNVIPIINLKKRFNLIGGNKNTRNIIIVRLQDTFLGIMIDSIHKKITLPESKILPPPPVVTGIGREYITGVGKDEDNKLIIILDINRLLSYEEHTTMKEVRTI